jgi:hypothetical protein
VQQRNVTVQVSARLLAVVKALPEGFAIFELREPFPNAHTLKLREKPLSRNEPVRSIAYLDGLRFAKGRFAEIASGSDISRDDPFAKVRPGSGLFEMWDIEEHNNDRYVLDYGASGAPILDCEGNVAAVASSFVTQGSLYFAGRELRLTTPWGVANNPPHLSNRCLILHFLSSQPGKGQRGAGALRRASAPSLVKLVHAASRSHDWRWTS